MGTFTCVTLLPFTKSVGFCDNYFRLKICAYPNLYEIISVLQLRRQSIVCISQKKDGSLLLLWEDKKLGHVKREDAINAENTYLDLNLETKLRYLEYVKGDANFIGITDHDELVTVDFDKFPTKLNHHQLIIRDGEGSLDHFGIRSLPTDDSKLFYAISFGKAKPKEGTKSYQVGEDLTIFDISALLNH
eukprot:TRINITY_DN3840_c0_g3_i2.p1 TRINITY_DN3840_c0_g3~~TRINITY_DN3840_c0_g3_i2.p1  ORF type:complete len:189 (-),score=26.95 TRINITY_DN3840_c0_g3_i2:121-687(-)